MEKPNEEDRLEKEVDEHTLRIIPSSELLKDDNEVFISHEGKMYCLSITRNGGLVLKR